MRLGIDLGLGSPATQVRGSVTPGIITPLGLVATPSVGAPALVSVSGIVPLGLVATPTVGAPTVEAPGGTNLIVNGDFADTTGWSWTGGQWDVTGGVANALTGSTGNLSQTISGLTPGNNYICSLDVTAYTSGGVRMQLLGSGGNATSPDYRRAVGTLSDSLVCPADTDGTLTLRIQKENTATVLSVDNVSVVAA